MMTYSQSPHRRSPSTMLLGPLCALLLASGCDARITGGGGRQDASFVDMTGPVSRCTDGEHRCYGQEYQGCDGGQWMQLAVCPDQCVSGLGCTQCRPTVDYCDGDTVRSCKDDGTPGDAKVTCAQGMCAAGDCNDPCGHAALHASYLGCDYAPTVTANAELSAAGVHFAVAVANPGTTDVGVAVTGAGAMGINVSVAPGQLQTIELPWVDALKAAGSSVLVNDGAFHLKSTAPVTVYQFNPLEFQAPGAGYTYTNDASLLLPTTTLNKHYMAVSRPTFMVQDITKDLFGTSTDYVARSPGFITVVATEPGTTNVTMKFTAPTTAGNSFPAYAAGQTGSFQLQQGQVLQIFSQVPGSCSPTRKDQVDSSIFGGEWYGYCDLPATDLTGTEITGDQRIAVFSGHNCTFVPYDKWACDHLEEEMLPLEGWGKRYHGTKIIRMPGSIPDLFRVVSAVDNNTITFEPAGVHAPVTLGRGQWMEFATTVDFEANGTQPFTVVQFMVGQDYNGFQSGGSNPGDPAMSLAVPVEQYRDSYIFLTPATYTQNYVNVASPVGEVVMLDGAAIDAAKFTPIGASGFQAARVAVPAGTHKITSAKPFGIEVYGLAAYTSYMYPGGLDIKTINDIGLQ